MNQLLKNHRLHKTLRLAGLIVILCSLVLVLFVCLIGWGAFGQLPTKDQIKHIDNPQASIIYADNGEILGKYFLENRTNVTYEDISTHIINALIATEDKRFREHRGIDWHSMGRVLIKSILLQDERSGGGSTITQQLAKNLFPRKSYRIGSLPINKVREMFTAIRIEDVLNKSHILTLYLNTVSFGGTTFGINAVCRQFFGKTPDQVNVQEAALLIGLLKATTSYHPQNNIEKSRARRNVVLTQMHHAAYLTKEQVDSISSLPVLLNWVDERHDHGIAPYFREILRLHTHKILDDYNATHKTNINLYTDGLKIYTTIDPVQQMAAERAVIRRMKALQSLFEKHWPNRKPWHSQDVLQEQIINSERYESYYKRGYSSSTIDSLFDQKVPMKIFGYAGDHQVSMSPKDSIKYYLGLLQTGMLSMNPKSGAIKSWVGGVDYEFFKYDHVLSRRQTGSIFKPIVYARALQIGYRPCDYLENELITYEDYDNWTPQNADEVYGGHYSLQGALSNSVNTISVKLALEAGIKSIVQLAHQMGISSQLPEVPSISLGTGEVSLLEMVQMFSTIANDGKYQPNYFIDLIVNARHDTIYQHHKAAPLQVLNTEHARLISYMLTRAVDNGTGKSLRSVFGIQDQIAGKTGTTQSHTDGWFIGFTPELVAGVWVGGDNPIVKFRSLDLGQGAYTALPIWAYWYKDLMSTKSGARQYSSSFPPLPSEWKEQLDCDDFIDTLHWTDFLEELIAQESQNRRNERKQTRKTRKKVDRQNGLGSFLKKLFKKKN